MKNLGIFENGTVSMCAFIPMLQTVSHALFTDMYKVILHTVLLLFSGFFFSSVDYRSLHYCRFFSRHFGRTGTVLYAYVPTITDSSLSVYFHSVE